MDEPPEVEPWVNAKSRLVLVGEAAHPFPVCLSLPPAPLSWILNFPQRGSVHGPAASVSDAAALGELFRHLHSDSQIDSFISAYESIRRDRVKSVIQVELANVFVITLPAGEQKDRRDAAMRANHEAGLDVFAGDHDLDDSEVAAHWEVSFP